MDLINYNVNELITTANNIVETCVGIGCQTSQETRALVTQQIATLGRQQAHELVSNLAPSSAAARVIYDKYNNLASNVAVVYNGECNNNVIMSKICVNRAIAVQDSKEKLYKILQPVHVSNTTNLIIICFFSVFAFLTFFLFFLFFVIALFSSITHKDAIDAKPATPSNISKESTMSTKPKKTIKFVSDNESEIALPVSPLEV